MVKHSENKDSEVVITTEQYANVRPKDNGEEHSKPHMLTSQEDLQQTGISSCEKRPPSCPTTGEEIHLSSSVDSESGVGNVLSADPYYLPYYGIVVNLSAFKKSQPSEQLEDIEQKLELSSSEINKKDSTGPNIDMCGQPDAEDVDIETEYKPETSLYTEQKLLKEARVDEDPSMVEIEEGTASLSDLAKDLGITYRPDITQEDIFR